MANILIMEDDHEQALLLSDWLEAGGYKTVITANADEALAALASETQFDLILSDVVVSRSDSARGGLSLIGHTRHSTDKHLQNIPIITISGYDEQTLSSDIPSQCLRLGSDAHFKKPVDPNQLHETISDLLALGK